jgi:hypothetical protein
VTAAVYKTAIKETHCICISGHTKTASRPFAHNYEVCYGFHVTRELCCTSTNQYLNAADKFGSCVISGPSREGDEKCALVGYYAASGGNLLPTFRDNK